MNVSKTWCRRSIAGAALLGAVLLASAGWADNLGYRAYVQQWNPAKPADNSVAVGGALYGALSTDIVNAWNQFTQIAKPVLTTDLEKSNLIGQGFSLYNVALNLGAVETVEMRVAPVQDGLAPALFQTPSADSPVLVIHSTQTSVSASSTTPVTSRSTDPAFQVTFDLTAYIKLTGGPRAAADMLPGAAVVISNTTVSPAAGNLAADVLQAFGQIQNFFGARSFSQMASDSFNGANVNISAALAPAIQAANQKLRSSAPAGYVVAGIFADSQYLNIVVAPHLQPDSGGQMAGALTVSGLSVVPASQRSAPGANQSCSNAFSLSDSVQVQPDYVQSLNPLKFISGSGSVVSLDNQIQINGGTIVPSADGWNCRYSVAGLADSFANNLKFNEPGVKSSGSLPAVGYVIDVGFQGCKNGAAGPIHSSDVACLTTPGICGVPLVPANGIPANCNLVGTIQLSASSGVGLIKQGALANQALPNATPVQSGATASPNPWGAQTLNRSVSAISSTPQWGTSNSTAAGGTPSGGIAAGSSINRGVGSSLQNRAPNALPSSTSTLNTAQ